MALLTTATCLLAVKSEASPAAGGDVDSSLNAPPSPRLTRVILPKKKPLKWSTGTAPGEYGGPPTTTKLRKYWGGGDEDPITAVDDFIWNKDFVGHMKRFLRDEPNAPSTFSSRAEQSSGFLSLNRAMSLDSVGIDLSEELRQPPKPVLEQQVEAARRGRSAAEKTEDVASPRWRLVPTRREQAKWDRATKATTGGSDVIIRESSRTRRDPRILAAQSTEEYVKLKENLQVLTLGIGGIGVISAYVTYSPEIAASFGAGLIGSLIYIRMLGNTIDSFAVGAKGLIKGAVGQPRLLVPVAIVMIYNRWNESSAEAEYRALAFTVSELVWLKQLLGDFQVKCNDPVTIFCDNLAAIHIATNPVFHERTKHIEIDCHFVRERVADGFIKLLPVRTTSQLADIFTKPLPLRPLTSIMSKMSISNLHSPS